MTTSKNLIAVLLFAMVLLPAAFAKPVAKKEKIDEALSAAFRDCVNEATKDNKINLSKTEVDGRNWSIISADCNNDKAKALYEAVGTYSEEQYVHYSDGRRGIARFFGKLVPPSQCSRVTRNAKGVEMNLYSCSIRLDVVFDMVKDIKP